MRKRWRSKRCAAGAKPRKKRLNAEHQEQAAMYAEFLKRGAPGAEFVAIPNGEYRPPSVANRLRAEGVQPGWSDLIGIEPRRCPECGRAYLYWHEHKKAGGRLSADQREVHRRLRALGHKVEVSYGLAQGLAVMEKHGILKRSSDDFQPSRDGRTCISAH